jgi:NADPH-dependent curcumin reductase CurA
MKPDGSTSADVTPNQVRFRGKAWPSRAAAVVLRQRPRAMIGAGDLEVVELPVRSPRDGEVTFRTIYTSVDPYQLGMLRGNGITSSDLRIGDVVPANSVGEVINSMDPRAPVGSLVAVYSGWREYVTTRLNPSEIADRRLGDAADWISILNTPGVTAYIGLHDVGNVSAGQTVLVNAAAGAVGGAAVQIAKAANAKVIAVAGGAMRSEHTRTLGADFALDYMDAGFAQNLKDAAAQSGGIDLFFDNVGGQQLAATLPMLATGSTAVLCGAVSSYADANHSPAPVDLSSAAAKRLTIRGFIVSDYNELRLLPTREALAALRASGSLKTVLSQSEGLSSAESALRGMFQQGSSDPGKRVLAL